MRQPTGIFSKTISNMRAEGFRLKLLLLLIPLFGFVSLACNKNDISDSVLFGLSLIDGDSVPPGESCASEIVVSQTQINLVEDGTQTLTYPATEAAPISGYGLNSVQTCVYLSTAFTGTGEVTIPITTNNTYTGRINITPALPTTPAELVFTASGETNKQCFTITRVNDLDRNTVEAPFAISLGEISATGTASAYDGKNPCDVSVTVEDDEGPGVRVSSISQIMEEPTGTPAAANMANFKVRLRTAPTANVTIPISDTYDATNSGNREGTADKSSLLFTTANWFTEQTVTITSNDDLQVDGTKTYTVGVQPASSTDAEYNGIDGRNVVVINNDKSIPGYTYAKWDTSGGDTGSSAGTISGFATDEMGNMGTTYSHFTIKLRSKPSNDVTLNFSTNNTSISTVQTPTLVFTPSNWNVAQTVSVVGKSDSGSNNGNVDYTVSFNVTTSDDTYDSIAKPTFSMRSCDNDGGHEIHTCNFSGSPLGTSGNRLSGGEPSATTYMWLISKSSPASTITVGLTSTDTSEGTVPGSVSIDSSNYNSLGATANRIALSHVDDLLLDGNQDWTVTTAAATGGSTYNPVDVFARTTDNEQRYYIYVSGTTKEDDSKTATIHICLGATNTQTVTINAACASADECDSVSPTSVAFSPGEVITAGTPSNSACQGDGNSKTITVHGADDAFADGTQTFTVNLTVSTTDTVYTGNNPSNQTVSNEDDEQPGKAIFVTGTSYAGEMTGVGGADNFCQTRKSTDAPSAPSGTYKALISSNGATGIRIATTDGSSSAGQTGWILTPNYYYYRCESGSCSDEAAHLFVANSAGLIPTPMSTNFTSSGLGEFWTGMNANMTPATQTSTPGKKDPGDPDYRHNCAGWTYNEAPSSDAGDAGAFDYYGQTWGGGSSITNVACSSTKKLICVQQ